MSEGIPTERPESAERLSWRIESLSEKGTGEMNEDALFIGRNRFGVFDGATSLDRYVDENRKTGGYLASMIAKEALETSEGSLIDIALIANGRIREAMCAKGIDMDQKERLWGTAAAVVEINPSGKTFEWVQISDSLILLINKDGTSRITTPDFEDQDRDIFIHWKELVDRGVENVREVLNDEIMQHRRDSNVTYGVLNGEEATAGFLRSGRESLEGIAHILIFTDGLFIPKEDRREPHDFGLIAKLFLEGGLENVKRYVREIQESDPDCTRYVRSKQSDDMTAIAISFV